MWRFLVLALALNCAQCDHIELDDSKAFNEFLASRSLAPRLLSVGDSDIQNKPKINLNLTAFVADMKKAIPEFLNKVEKVKDDRKELKKQSNKFADYVLSKLKKTLKKGIEPMPLPDVSKTFSYTWVIATSTGTLTMNKGQARKIYTVERGGSVRMKIKGAHVKVEVPLQLEVVPFKYDYSSAVWGMHPSGQIKGTLKKFKAVLKLVGNAEKRKIKRAVFEIKDLGEIKFEFEGGGLIDYVLNLLVPLVKSTVESTVKYMVDGYIKSEMHEFVEDVNKAMAKNATY